MVVFLHDIGCALGWVEYCAHLAMSCGRVRVAGGLVSAGGLTRRGGDTGRVRLRRLSICVTSGVDMPPGRYPCC